jgi:hypothetical protein
LSKLIHDFYRGPKIWAIYIIFKTRGNSHPSEQKFGESGHPAAYESCWNFSSAKRSHLSEIHFFQVRTFFSLLIYFQPENDKNLLKTKINYFLQSCKSMPVHICNWIWNWLVGALSETFSWLGMVLSCPTCHWKQDW